jgi:hypothetical protein
MSVKDSMTTHPNYEAVAQAVGQWLSKLNLQCNSAEEAMAIEKTAISEILHLTDISAFGSASHNMAMYLEGKIDNTGKTVGYGEKGQLARVRQKAIKDMDPLPKSGFDVRSFFNLLANWSAGCKIGLSVPERFMSIAHQACVPLSMKDAEIYAAEALDHGATSFEESLTYLNHRLGQLNPSGYEISIGDAVQHSRILREVTRHIEGNGLVRMAWQCRNYADAIFSSNQRGQWLSDSDIYNSLGGIIARESETARGIIAIGEKPDPFADMSPEHKAVAEEVRRVLAAQGESWTMGKIREFSRKLWDANAKNGWPTCEYIAEQVLVALEMGDTKQSITRNIGEAEVVVNSRYSGVDALNALISLENTALQEPVKAFEVDDHYRYTRNDVQFVIAREYGQSPEGNPLMGSWVIRNFFTGDYIDHDRHRTDLAERHAIKLES